MLDVERHELATHDVMTIAHSHVEDPAADMRSERLTRHEGGLLLKRAGLHTTEFADYWLLIKSCGRRAWAGSVAAARHMKEMAE